MKNLLLITSIAVTSFGCSQDNTAAENIATSSVNNTSVNSLANETQSKLFTMNDKALTDKSDIINLPNVERAIIANVDFTLHEESSEYATFYDDPKTDSLGIDAANLAFRTKYAKASYTITEAGSFELGFVALSEFDGESNYKLMLNGELVGDFTNPRTELDFHEVYFRTGQTVTLTAGDELTVEAIAASNGEIPEDGGYAWARGRWRAVTLLANVD